MEAGEEFLVVHEGEADNSSKGPITELRSVIDLFYSSIAALNQSTILLRDELQNALSSALEHLGPEDKESTEELLKAFNKSVNSTEEVRKDYMRHVCKRLVALENEKQTLQIECNRLRAGSWLSSQNEEVDELNKLIMEISCSVKVLEKDAGVQRDTSTEFEPENNSSMTLLSSRLTDVRDRLSRLCAVKSMKSGETAQKDNEEIPAEDKDRSSELGSNKSKNKDKNGKCVKSENAQQKRFQRKVEQYLGLMDKRVEFQGLSEGEGAEDGSDTELSEAASVTSTKSNPAMPDLIDHYRMLMYARMAGNGPQQVPMMGYNWGAQVPRPVVYDPYSTGFPRPYMFPRQPRPTIPIRGQFRPPYKLPGHHRRRSYSKPNTNTKTEGKE